MNLPEIAKKLRALADELDAAVAPEQPKPFTLPTPPPGMKWHREDGWTAEMLPPGTRPLVKGETKQPEDEAYGVEKTRWYKVYFPFAVVRRINHCRTTRPLTFTHGGHEWAWHRAGDPMPCDGERSVAILQDDGRIYGARQPIKAKKWDWQPVIGWRYADAQQPDPYAELKAAHAEGKVIQFFSKTSDRWNDCNELDLPTWTSPPDRYRIKPDDGPPWIEWRGGECPLSDEEVEELQQSDPYAELKAAHAKGKEIQCEQHFLGSGYWYAIDNPEWDEEPSRYRIKPDEIPWIKWHGGKCPLKDEEVEEWQIKWANGDITTNPKASPSDYIWTKLNSPDDIAAYRVLKTRKPAPKQKLGPEDVPPFSLIRRKPEQNNGQQWHWRCVSYVHNVGIQCGDRGYKWKEMQEDYQINRSLPLTGKWNPEAWEACEK